MQVRLGEGYTSSSIVQNILYQAARPGKDVKSPSSSNCALAMRLQATICVSYLQVRLGKYKEALAAYSRAADLAPGIAGYRLRQAELLFQNSREADADLMMRGVVRKNPNFAGECLCFLAPSPSLHTANRATRRAFSKACHWPWSGLHA